MALPGQVSISVVIPTYNYAATLPRAVESVLGQLGPGHELIVIDDGSTDSTPAVVTELLGRHPNAFRATRKENGGVSSARNRGIREARGSYLVFLDADDELAPGALTALDEHLRAHPETRMVIGGHISVRPDGKRREHVPRDLPDQPLERFRDYLLNKRIALSNGACVMHREVFVRGNYPEAFRCAEDVPVFAQALANYPNTVLKRPIALIHKHEGSLRHQFEHARALGLTLVDEVFSPQRLPAAFHRERKAFFVQRCLSLFRSAYLAQDIAVAKDYFRLAVRTDWRVIGKMSYLRKAVRLWLGMRA